MVGFPKAQNESCIILGVTIFKATDKKTNTAFLRNAGACSQDWLSQPEPVDIYQITQNSFQVSGLNFSNDHFNLSWRTTEFVGVRHKDARLYFAFAPDLIVSPVEVTNVIFYEDKINISSNKRVYRLVWQNK